MLANHGWRRLGLVVVVGWLGFTPGAWGESRIRGQMPPDLPTVTLRSRNEPIAEVLLQIGRQVGLDLFLADPPDDKTQRISVQYKDVAPETALEELLGKANLYATLRGRVLTVSKRDAPFAPDLPGGGGARGAALEDATEPAGPPAQGETAKPKTFNLSLEKLNQGFRRFDPLNPGLFETERVERGQEVEMAIAIGKPLTVAGRVNGAAVSVSGSVTLESSAMVVGDVIALGGEVQVKPGAVVLGRRLGLASFWVKPLAKVLALAMKKETLYLAVILLQLGVYAFLFLVGLLVIALWPQRVAGVRSYLGAHPLLSLLGGVLLFATWIGICLILALTFGLFAASPVLTYLAAAIVLLGPIALCGLGLLGGTAFFIWLGDLLPLPPKQKNPLLALSLGLLLTTAVTIVPYVGPVVQLLVSLLGPGAVLLSRLGTYLPPPLPGEPFAER